MPEEKKFSVVDFLINTPLYEAVALVDDSRTDIRFLKLECFCDNCSKDKSFIFYDIINYPLEKNRELEPFLLLRKNVPAEFILQFECTNCGGLISYGIKVSDGNAWKFGQNPAFSLLQKNEMSKYRVEMPNVYKEFSDAIQIYANGSALGAFLLGRRIFVHLLDIDYKRYFPFGKDKLLTDKVRSLEVDKHFVFPPDMDSLKTKILTELDKEIADYTEEECKENFSILRVCIEYLTDKHVEEKRRASKLREAIRVFRPRSEE